MSLTWAPPRLNNMEANFVWSANHAAEVWLERPWTDIAVQRNDIAQLVVDATDGVDVKSGFFEAMAVTMANEFTDVIDNYDWGIASKNRKVYRDAPTWGTITDSGELAESLTVEVKGL